jgi:multicomponent Na+:H+ antiporter subunit D
MVVGVLGAAAQNEIRRILAFHIVSQIGYMVMGLALFTPLALTGAIFFVAHNIIVKTNLFLIGGVVERLQGTAQLKQLGGLYRTWPGLTALFLITALALAGLPPFSGFWAKLLLVQAGLAAEAWIIVAVSLVVSILTLYSMTKIWNEAFWKEAMTEAALPQPLGRRAAWSLLTPIVALTLLAVGMGIFVEPLLQVTTAAAAQLLDPTAYIQAVLGTEAQLAARQ